MKQYAEYASVWACKNVVHFYFISNCTCTNTYTKSHQNYLANFGPKQVARHSKKCHESLEKPNTTCTPVYYQTVRVSVIRHGTDGLLMPKLIF